MSNTVVNPIVFKNGLRSHISACNVIREIVKTVSEIPEVEKHRTSVELLQSIVNAVEQACFDHKLKLDKKAVVLDIYTHVFTNFTEELLIVQNIEFLWVNKRITCNKYGKVWAFLKKMFDLLFKPAVEVAANRK